MSTLSVVLTFILVLVAMGFSAWGKIGLGKEMLVASFRAVIQLVAVGFALKYIFRVNSFLFTSLILLVMVFNAAQIAAKRGPGVRHGLAIAFLSIVCGLTVTLGTLVSIKAIAFTASQAIPISGMVVGNTMIAVSLVYRLLTRSYQEKRDEVEVKLSLGAPPGEASAELIRESIRTAMVPTVDSMKTLGIVQLPGMMTGMILAGTKPEMAIKYQIMVVFMLTGAVAISVFLASFLAYRGFFNRLAQLETA